MIARLPGVARGGAFLIEPLGSRGVFTTGKFTDEQLAYTKVAETFVAKEVLPHLDAIESREDGLMPRLLKRAGELGLLMIDIPEQDGGLGLNKATSMLVSERAAKVASFSVSRGAHTGIGTLPLGYYGTAEQKARYLPKLASCSLTRARARSSSGTWRRCAPSRPSFRSARSTRRPASPRAWWRTRAGASPKRAADSTRPAASLGALSSDPATSWLRTRATARFSRSSSGARGDRKPGGSLIAPRPS